MYYLNIYKLFLVTEYLKFVFIFYPKDIISFIINIINLNPYLIRHGVIMNQFTRKIYYSEIDSDKIELIENVDTNNNLTDEQLLCQIASQRNNVNIDFTKPELKNSELISWDLVPDCTMLLVNLNSEQKLYNICDGNKIAEFDYFKNRRIIISSVSYGNGSEFDITKSSECYSCGINCNGQLGLGDYRYREIPEKINLSGIINISGSSHTIAIGVLDNKNKLFGWGYNLYGQLGLGHILDVTSPQEINLSDAIAANCHCSSTIVLTRHGDIYFMGVERDMRHLRSFLTHHFPHKLSLGMKIRSISYTNEGNILITDDNKIYFKFDKFHSKDYLQEVSEDSLKSSVHLKDKL